MAKHSSEKQLNRSGNRRGMSQNSHRNLGVYLKGNGHAKKDYSITRIVKAMIDDPVAERWLEVEDKGKGMTFRQAIAKRMLVEAVRGNVKATSDLLERLEGKVTQPIEGSLEIRDAGDLSDEQLAVIAAGNILKNNTARSGNGTPEEASSS